MIVHVSALVPPTPGLTTATTRYGAFGSSTVAPRGYAVPTGDTLDVSRIEVQLDTVAGGAANLNCWLTFDEAGDYLIQPAATAVLQTPPSGTAGLAAAFFDFSQGHLVLEEGQRIHLWASLDAGTGNLTFAKLFYRVA